MHTQLFSTFHIGRLFNLACVFVLGLCLNPQLQAQDLGNGTERCGADAFLKEQLQRQNMSIDEYLSQMRTVMQANSPASGNRQ